MYKIEIDQPCMFKLTLDGAIPLAQVDTLMRESRAAVRRLQCAPGDHLALVDASISTLHPQDVASAFSVLARDFHLPARRLAIVANSALWRLQTRRILENYNVAFFDTVADAERWLLTADESAVDDHT